VVDQIVKKAELMSCRNEREGTVSICTIIYWLLKLINHHVAGELGLQSKLYDDGGPERCDADLDRDEPSTSLSDGGTVAPMAVISFILYHTTQCPCQSHIVLYQKRSRP
jgi:hypothetical protein